MGRSRTLPGSASSRMKILARGVTTGLGDRKRDDVGAKRAHHLHRTSKPALRAAGQCRVKRLTNDVDRKTTGGMVQRPSTVDEEHLAYQYF
ncbi:hypothetical protein FIBSPDRAFT_880550 [Athelia psychrophila]|uniref:Uncharacterized protein n=1 Tax=Athelia psychrophila TaxID=1759441 RepID=A0A167SQ65_9AGAM|nr:hypothetical protein FIBSPDRAFT_880550 [Fibularhizoctonia sp. CBS 109695]